MAQMTLNGWLIGQAAGIAGDSSIAEVAAAYDSFAIRYHNGRLAVWGGGPPPSLDTELDAIDAGWDHFLGLDSDGKVHAWGTTQFVPEDLPIAISVVAGYGMSGAVLHDGSVRVWTDAGYQVVPPDLGPVSKLDIGGHHCIALLDDGTVRCWGDNAYGQCDIPTRMGAVIDVAAGGNHSVAITIDGGIVCWGQNAGEGVWGPYTIGQCDVPPALPPAHRVAAGAWHTVALLHDGSVRSWGGGGACEQRGQTIAVDAVATSIEAGVMSSVVILQTGDVVSAGLGAGSLGQPDCGKCWCDSPYAMTVPASTSSLLAAYATRAAWDNPGATMLSIGADGHVGCWTFVQYMYGPDQSNNYTRVCNAPGDLGMVQHVSPGHTHALAIQFDGTLRQWPTDAQVPDGLRAVDVWAFARHSFASTEAGDVHYWQSPGFSWLEQANLEPPPSLKPVVAIRAGMLHAVARHDDGTLTAWGQNTYGQCDVPPGLGHVTDVAAGWYHSVALLQDGTVTCWGKNDHGQCSPPPDLTGVVAIAAGERGSVAMCADGAIHRWGQFVGPLDELPTTGTRLVGDELVLSGCGVRWVDTPNIPTADGGAAYQVQVAASADDCEWLARSWADWMRVDGKGTGSGSGTLEIVVDPNPLTRLRIGALDVGGVRRVVVQDGGLDCNGNGLGDGYEIATGVEVDFNGNGIPDTCECIADIDGNGLVDGGDIALLLTAWESTGDGLPADVDANGLVNGGDMGVLLSSWGACP